MFARVTTTSRTAHRAVNQPLHVDASHGAGDVVRHPGARTTGMRTSGLGLVVGPAGAFDATEGNVKETLERVLLALNILLICLLGFLAFRVGGPGRAAVATWAAERRAASTLRTRWPDISAAGNRIDSMGAAVRLVEFADY